MTREKKQEFTLRVTQANSTEMIVILYEILFCYLEEGRQSVISQNDTEYDHSIRKAKSVINELMNSLNTDYEPAASLLGLYGFIIRELTRAQIKRSSELLEEVERLLRPICEAYRSISSLNDKGPVMKNSQTVYAGITYGKNTLTENMADQGTNRGILA